VITFSQPIFLALLVLLPISVLIALPRLFGRRTIDNRRQSGRPSSAVGRRQFNKRSLFSLFVRFGMLTCLIFALAGIQAVQFTSKLAVAFLIDASDSVGPNGREQAAQFVRDALRSMRVDGNDQAAVVVFGSDAQIERALSTVRDLAPLGAQVRSAGTNIEDAIRMGLSLLPADAARRIVLLSDGKQTVGDAESAARLARAANTRLDVVPLPSVQGPDAAVERIDAPQRASVGQVIPLQIVVRSNAPMVAQLTIFAGPDVVAQETVNLVAGQNEFNIRANATRAGFSSFRVQLTPQNDVRPQNNALSSSVIVGGPPRVLLIAVPPAASSSGVDETSALKAALDATGIVYDEVSPRAMPSEIQSLAGYQAILLVNVPARELSLRAMYSLQSYVRDIGGGLVVVGGPNSYGVGGYYKTPLEETLPVEMQVKDPKRFPSVSIVIVMDKSGSMSAQENGVLKMRLAAEAAARVAELINEDDEVTVIGFDTEPVDVIGPFFGRDRTRFIPKILGIAPGGGGIYVYDSLKEAERIISKSTKLSKFVILLADGSDSEQQEGARELVRKMRNDDNVTLTVVAIGDGSDVPFLKNVASIGKGRFHLTDKAANLPTIFTEETALAQRSYIVEQDFFPKQSIGSPILSGITEVPQLRGYIASTAKPAAQVILKASESDPLLATWQYGLGRAVAFTSDATGRWGRNWVAWKEFPKFWAQAIRWTILERSQSAIRAGVQQRGDQTIITADLPEMRVDEDLRLTANVIDSEGKSQHISLSQTAPGRYEAETYLDQAGAYFIRVAPASITTTTATTSAPAAIPAAIPATITETTVAWVKPYSPEYAQTTGGEGALKEWADLGGGAALTSPASAFELNAPVALSRTDLFPLLLAIAAILLPFDIGVRRITVSLRKLFGLAGASLAPATSIEGSGRMGQLMQAKSRVTREPNLSSTRRASGNTRSGAPGGAPGSAPGTGGAPSTIPASSSAPSQPIQTEPPQASATASELLRRRKRRSGESDDKKDGEQK
jgi:uncharacterized membrane protein